MKSEQERMQKLLKNELTEEADKIMKEVEADESLKDIVLPEELDAGLRAKIEQYEAEKAAYEMLSDKDKEAIRIGREIQIQRANDGNGDDDDGNGGDKGAGGGGTDGENYNERRVVRFRKRRRMAFALVAIVAVMVMGFGMTSIGGKPFIPQLFEQMLAGRENVNIDTENEDKIISNDVQEENVYQSIKDEFGFDPVEIRQLPSGTSFLEGSVDSNLQEACLLYNFEDNIIEYRIFINYMNKASGYDIEDKLLDKRIIKVNGQDITVKKYQISDTNEVQYMAQFKYNNVYYVLNAVMDETEFLEIINSLKFF